ncbi:MAG: SulP family inorganic anion transporter [Nitriliruptorales bacterium]
MSHRFPAALVVVGVLAAAVWLLDLGAAGLTLVGDVPAGLPAPSVPWATGDVFAPLLRGAVVIALVGYLEGVSVAKAIALRSRERIDVDQELIANGAASIGAAAYRWDDLDLAHDFWPTRQGIRYTIGGPARTEILGRLLELDHGRYELELKEGLHEGKKRTSSRKPAGQLSFDD